jgi:hypothetical protein
MLPVRPTTGQVCRACGSFDIRPSYLRFLDGVIAFIRPFEVFRCRACQHRFRVYLKTPAGAKNSGTPQVPSSKELAKKS